MEALFFQFMNIFVCMISIIFLTYILIRELIRRGKLAAKKQKIPKMESILNKFSFTTILFCFIKTSTLCLFQVPGICEWISPKSDIPIMAIRISFTFYQISRFIHCFGPTYKFRYNNDCKYILVITIAYLIGFLILVSSIISRIFFVDIVPKGSYGCDFVPGKPTVGAITFFVYYAWDLSVLYIYVKKLKNLKKENQDEDEPEIGRRAKARKFLYKMLFLTISMETVSFICVPLATFLLSAVFAEQAYFLWYIFWNLEIISTAYIQYLMIIPNRNQYKKFINQLSKYKCCCLCRTSFAYKSVGIITQQDLSRMRINLISIRSMSSDNAAEQTDTRISTGSHVIIQESTTSSINALEAETSIEDHISDENEISSDNNNQEIIQENYETKTDKNDITNMYEDVPQVVNDRVTRNSTNPISVVSMKTATSSITGRDNYDNIDDNTQQQTLSLINASGTEARADNNNSCPEIIFTSADNNTSIK